MMFKGLVMGRIVRVTTAGGYHPAIVTQVLELGMVNLQVFFIDHIEAWQEILYSEEKAVGAWHWPPRDA